MKKIFLLACIALIHFVVFAEVPEIKFGKIDVSDLTSNTCDIDSTAEAYYIGDYGKTYFTYGYNGVTVNFERHVRIKILKKSAFEYASFMLSIYKNDFYTVKGFTYNLENGQVVKEKLEKKNIFKESFTKKKDHLKFSLPNVKEGSVIDVFYQITSTSFVIPDWDFQHYIPVKYTEYKVSIPEYFIYKRFLNGYESVHSKDDIENGSFDFGYGQILQFRNNTSIYSRENMPAFKTEPYITSTINYLSSIEFEIQTVQIPGRMTEHYSKDWTSITKELLEDEDFGLKLNRSGFIEDTVKMLIKDCITPQDKMKSIYDYLRNNVKFDYNYSIWSYAQNLKEVIKNHAGNCADINLLLIVMLREAGLKAEPVILSTRANGIPMLEYPILSKFNYVIANVNVDGKEYLLDATDKYCPFGMLPFRCLNNSGRLISKERFYDVKLAPSASYSSTTMIQAKINDNNDIIGSIQKSLKGYAAHNFRDDYYDFKNVDEFIKEYQNSHSGLVINKLTFDALDTIDKPVKINFTDINISGKVEVTGNILSFNPMLYEQTENNPFKLEQRTYPVDYGHNYDQTYVLQFDIPEGYVVDEIPKPIILSMPENAARFSYNVTVVNNKIQLMRKFSINKTMFTSAEYPQLKEFYNQLVAKEAELIVLKKN
jgi:hypothetical protein